MTEEEKAAEQALVRYVYKVAYSNGYGDGKAGLTRDSEELTDEEVALFGVLSEAKRLRLD